MRRFVVTRRARLDLLAIWRRIADDRGAETADRIITEFYDAIQMLAEFPAMGHKRADVTKPRYRFWSVYKFVIAYRTDLQPLTISRVLHGARDFAKLFR